MSETRTISYRDAIREAHHEALAADERVFLMGEDVGRYGGAYACSKGLIDEFGEERIRDTPLSESGFTGAACRPACRQQWCWRTRTAVKSGHWWETGMPGGRALTGRWTLVAGSVQ